MHETDGILMKQMNARAQLKSLEGANKAEMKGGDGRRNEVVQKTKHGRFLRHSAVMIEQRPWLEGQA